MKRVKTKKIPENTGEELVKRKKVADLLSKARARGVRMPADVKRAG